MDPSTMAACSSSGCEDSTPEDLAFRILLHLPVASLLRFKSVCKSWLSHIGSPCFISQHTRRHHHDHDHDDHHHKLVVLNAPKYLFIQYFYFMFNFISLHNPQPSSTYLEFSPTAQLHEVLQFRNQKLIASFDGVICLKHKRSVETKHGMATFDVVSLWNPATMQFTILPPPQLDVRESSQVRVEYGFGFDRATNDYKVVRVVVEDLVFGSDALKSQVEVYSLRMDSWRVIQGGVPLKFSITYHPKKPFRNEIYCWSAYEWMSARPLIVSFDFSKETFEIIPMPYVYTSASECRLFLDFLRGKIACIDWTFDDQDHRNVWVLDNYGVKESWTKLYTITLDPLDETMGFSMDGKIIVIKGLIERKLCLCDPLTQDVDEVPTQGLISDAVGYKESLISVKSANGVTRRVVYEDLSEKMYNLLGWGIDVPEQNSECTMEDASPGNFLDPLASEEQLELQTQMEPEQSDH